jgi:WD40 repeat protein
MKKILTLFSIIYFIITIPVFSQRKPPAAPPAAGMRPVEMKISGNGKHIIAAYDSCTIVWDISKREILRRIPRNLSCYPLYKSTIQALNQDGSLLAVGNNQELSLYNTENNKIIKQLNVLEQRKDPNTTDSMGYTTLIGWKHEYFKQIYFTPDKKYIIVISDEDNIRYVDLARDTISLVNVSHDPDLPRPSYQGDILALNSSQGRTVIRDNSSIIIFNLFSGKKEGEISLGYNNMDLYTISFSLNENKNKHSILLAGDKNYINYLLVCDMENRKILDAIKIDNKAHIVRLTSAENIVALAFDDSICLYNFQTGTEIARLAAYEEPKKPVKSKNNKPKTPGASQTEMRPKKAVFLTVQLGSFLSFYNALKLINDIESEGFKPFIERITINGATYWRVVINRVLENEITTLCELLSGAGFNNIWLRPDKREDK